MPISQSHAQHAINFIQQLRHTKGQWAGQPFILLPWEKDLVKRLFGTLRKDGTRQYHTAYIEIPKKSGKQLALDTPIPTPNGWKTMGALQVGDRVFDPTGQPCFVMALSEVDDTEPAYRLTFRDGCSIIAGERHLWNVELCRPKHPAALLTTGEVYHRYQATKKRYGGGPESRRAQVRIPVAEALVLPEHNLHIDPYLYGYWLGNGCATKPEITVRTCDVPTLLQQIPYPIHNQYTQQGGGSVVIKILALSTVLVPSFRDKVIRPEYLRGSQAQRWALLQGLVDSDGCIGSRKAQSTYVTTVPALARTVRELLWSLGIKNAMTAEPSTRYSVPTGETLYVIRFTSFDDQPTSRLERKVERRRVRKRLTRSNYHYLAEIEPLSDRIPMRCIQVSSPSHQYLAGSSMVPTHNSELGAAIALYMLLADGEQNAEVYSAACDRQQASIVFNTAVNFVQGHPVLSKITKVIASTKRIVFPRTGSFYQVLSSDVKSKSGLNISAAVIDEAWTHPSPDLIKMLTTGSGDARTQPLFLILTTAGNRLSGIGWELHQRAKDILEGRKIDPTFLPILYGLEEGDDWQDERNWHKANPSLGHTIQIERIREQFRAALDSPADQALFKQLRLNMWLKQNVKWMVAEKWAVCASPVDAKALEGRACYAGLDLSSTTDLTALVLVFPPTTEDEPYQVLPFFWLPVDTLPLRVRRDHVPYDVWQQQGFLQTTEGNVVHYGFIEQQIIKLGERYNIREIAFDRWNATQLSQNLSDDGFTMVAFGQGFKDMSPPTKELLRLVLGAQIAHGGHPVLHWMVDNVYLKTDAAGNVKPDKEKSTEKIDGVIAMVMGLARAMVHEGGTGESVYNSRGLLIL